MSDLAVRGKCSGATGNSDACMPQIAHWRTAGRPGAASRRVMDSQHGSAPRQPERERGRRQTACWLQESSVMGPRSWGAGAGRPTGLTKAGLSSPQSQNHKPIARSSRPLRPRELVRPRQPQHHRGSVAETSHGAHHLIRGQAVTSRPPLADFITPHCPDSFIATFPVKVP